MSIGEELVEERRRRRRAGDPRLSEAGRELFRRMTTGDLAGEFQDSLNAVSAADPLLGAPGEGYEYRNFTYAQLAIGTERGAGPKVGERADHRAVADRRVGAMGPHHRCAVTDRDIGQRGVRADGAAPADPGPAWYP